MFFIYSLQIVTGIVQNFCIKPLRIIMHEEGQLRIAKEKIKKNMFETLHVDSTTGFFNKLDDRNICYSAACFKGKCFFLYIKCITLLRLRFKKVLMGPSQRRREIRQV